MTTISSVRGVSVLTREAGDLEIRRGPYMVARVGITWRPDAVAATTNDQIREKSASFKASSVVRIRPSGVARGLLL